MNRDVYDVDGSHLLTSPAVADLLVAATEHAGGRLVSWSLEHVDASPNQSTTATYNAEVEWPYGVRRELLGVSARAGSLHASDELAEIFFDGEREVAVWLYPRDPDLPGLERAAYPEQMAELVNEHHLVDRPVSADQIALTMIGYRPRRRAVLKMQVADPARTFYVKVMRAKLFDDTLARHQLLRESPVPAPNVALATSDHLLVLDELPGRPLAKAMFDDVAPCTAEDLVETLDAMPASLAKLERRAPWTDAVAHYAGMVARALPSEQQRLDWLTTLITSGCADAPLGDEVTHGDFHEGQVHVADGRVVGLLDIDTIGPGSRVDDLACLVAHLSTVQRMNERQAERVHDLLRTWVPVFDLRVDPVQLRLRAAAVIISLATGPFRSQEPHWQASTVEILAAAEALARQVG